MQRDLSSRFRSLTRDLKSLNSYCTLYYEKLTDELGSEVVDDMIIESKRLYLKYEELEEKYYDIKLKK